MMNAVLTVESLRNCLTSLPAVELKGMALLRERRPPRQFFPPPTNSSSSMLPRDLITEAVVEIVSYMERSRQIANRLVSLTPIAITTFSIMEYGL